MSPSSMGRPDTEPVEAKLAMYRNPSNTEAALLARNALRSEHDPEHDPEHGPPLADSIAMHPVTGAFTDSTHESAFTSQLFRSAFSSHALLMALSLAASTWVTLIVSPEVALRPFWGIIVVCVALTLVGRVVLHRMDDSVRAQRIGSRTFTAALVLIVIVDFSGYVASAAHCAITSSEQLPANILFPLLSIAIAFVNGSHGLCFVHKAALIVLMMFDCLSSIAICLICVEAALAYEALLVVGFVVVHLAEMRWRRSYVEKQHERRLENEERQERRGLEQRNEQLQTSNERLLGLEQRNEQLQTSNERLRYDMQRRGHPLDDDDERSAIRRGLQAEPSHILADGTDASEAEAPSDAPPPSLPPGPPSSSSSNATKFNKAGSTSSKSSKAGSTFTSSTYRASPSQAGHSTVPPPSWAELAYRRHYAELAVKSATEQGEASGAQSNTAGKSAAPPLTWPEFYKALRKTKRKAEAGKAEPVPLSWAEGDRQFYASAAGKAYLAAANRQPFNLMRNASTASSSSAASSPVARLATEPEAALAPPDARVASSHEQRHAESTGVAWLTPEERCIHSMQPELAAEIAEMGEEEVFSFKDNPLFRDMAERAELGEEEQEAFFKDNPLNMAEMAEMGEEEGFAALIALMGSTSEN